MKNKDNASGNKSEIQLQNQKSNYQILKLYIKMLYLENTAENENESIFIIDLRKI